MSRKPSAAHSRLPTSAHVPSRRKHPTRLAALGVPSNIHSTRGITNNNSTRRASFSGLTSAPKSQRTSKTSQKLVVLPSAPQTKRLLDEFEEDLTLGFETDAGVKEYKSQAERMTKEQRKQAGFKRITAYCVSESFSMKLMASFLKREHNVLPRVFDEALYVMYHLPLLPGYGPNANIRSSAPAKLGKGKSLLKRLSEAEENGYQGTYFTSPAVRSPMSLQEGYISTSPAETRKEHRNLPRTPGAESVTDGGHTSASEYEVDATAHSDFETGAETGTETDTGTERGKLKVPVIIETPSEEPLPSSRSGEEEVVEVVFFEYGVVVFFGLTETQEKDILEDVENNGIMKRKFKEEDWEIEECHFAHDPYIAYPRIYNDFFTLKSRSHLLKLSIAHALAQSTLLARYETTAQRVLSSPVTLAIPKQLAESGGLHLRRHEALKLTGRLFKLRRDVNLVSNVLDVPELFWSEASLKDLYDAVREYMEIKPRVQVLNERLGVASDFLDAIHDHLNNSAMERITWIVIWLIVVACLVELGEVIARLIVHASMGGQNAALASSSNVITKEEALRALERMMLVQS